MKNIKVAFFDTKPYDREFFDKANEKFGFQLTYFETRLGSASARMAAGFDAVSAFVNDDVGEETVKELIRLGVKVIAMRCAGYNNVNLAAAYGKILVMRVPGYSPYAVAEYALAMLQTLNRSLHRAYNRIRENNFSINGLIGFDLRGKTFGIVGTGKIGRVFAELLQGFGVRLLAYDVFPNREAAKALHMEYVSLEKLYAESDVISLHCPLTPDNIHLINADAIARMKQGVYLINTSRGKLVDTAALIAGLKSRKIGGACLDVYEEESDYFFEDRSGSAIDDDILARLLTFPNVLVTSHQAFFTREAMTNIATAWRGANWSTASAISATGTGNVPARSRIPPPVTHNAVAFRPPGSDAREGGRAFSLSNRKEHHVRFRSTFHQCCPVLRQPRGTEALPCRSRAGHGDERRLPLSLLRRNHARRRRRRRLHSAAASGAQPVQLRRM